MHEMGKIYLKLIKWIKEHKIWSSTIAFIVILLPIVIVHSLFKIPAPYEWLIANWNAGEILGYSGDVLGAVATIIAIVLTILFTQENQKSERKLSVKPHLQTEYQPIFNLDIAIEQKNNRKVFIIYPLNEDEGIGSTYDPPYILEKYNKKDLESAILNKLEFLRSYYIIKYTLRNVGAGNAVNLTFTLNDKPVVTPFSLIVSDEKVFMIILKTELIRDTTRSLNFKYVYQDVASIAKYEQHETIILRKEESGNLNSSQNVNDIISQPEEI